MTASRFGGWQPAPVLALLFIAGMLVTDGINGWCIARLIRRTDQTARVASRVMALAVSGVGLLTAAFSVASQILPNIGVWAKGKELWFAGAVVAVILLSFAVGQRLARVKPQPAQCPAFGYGQRASH